LSTDFSDNRSDLANWISQAEAARLQGVSRQAIHKLVQSGRLRTMRIGGHVLVNREDVERFRPQVAGRPSAGDEREFERIKRILDSYDQPLRKRVLAYLTSSRELHPIERRLGVTSDVILEALARAGELTIRMFRGVLAEAAFAASVLPELRGWTEEPAGEGRPFDFLLKDESGLVRVQVKLQRSERGVPIRSASGHAIVETQKTRAGQSRKASPDAEGAGSTRPYRADEFDILAVCMQPSTGRWDDFRYTVARWLHRQKGNPNLLATYQPVSLLSDDDWTNVLKTCIERFRSGSERTLGGTTVRPRTARGKPPTKSE
jgi:excisionase family DNA binding protein